MKKDILVITGSARKNGDTARLIDLLFAGKSIHLIDLLDHAIHPYSYSADYPKDDRFISIIETVLEYDTVIFATPVYWYSMSGLMKIFFDRLTDIVTTHKQLGRKMKGKRVFAIATGADALVPEGFEVPFKRTSEYLEMEFVDCMYFPKSSLTGNLPGREEFLEKLK